MGEDNQPGLGLVDNPEATGRSKHVDFAYNMVRDNVARGEVTLYFLSGADMPANGLTKLLPAPAFILFWRVIGVGDNVCNAGLGATAAPSPASKC